MCILCNTEILLYISTIILSILLLHSIQQFLSEKCELKYLYIKHNKATWHFRNVGSVIYLRHICNFTEDVTVTDNWFFDEA